MLNREKIVNELLETERSYCVSLGTVKMFFMPALESYLNQKHTHFTREHFKTLFGNLNEITALATSLQKELRTEITAHSNSADACVGRIMRPRIADFLVYAKYLANFDHSLEVLGQITKKEKVAVLLKDAVAKSHVKLDLGSYLIMPVQRLPRYEMLMKEILKNTPETHADHTPLSEALSEMKTINRDINNLQREEGNRIKVNQISSKLVFEEKDNFVFPEKKDRMFNRQGALQVTVKAGTGKEMATIDPKSECYCVLFNDFLLVTRSNKDKFRVKHLVNLEHCNKVTEHETNGCVFFIETRDKIFICKSHINDKDAWAWRNSLSSNIDMAAIANNIA
uniref:DH domain-containing protein n=1 Tax=Paramoeba aestuarina TaxID=180227 RepID=A0A7S4NZ73_9EUKA|mmetsp:Transcript_3338/g.5082  ORF Transcript_3338/g.5082 Transcript_3338/m.5082 type:complete len:338 (+) Transcript_3338:155-1168(+)